MWRGLCLVVVVVAAVTGAVEGQLQPSFYQSRCPNVESIVQQIVSRKISQTFGCDASVIIQSPNNDVEKDAFENLSLAGDGFDTVIKAKQAVEAQCPGVVSCTDILTIAARDVVSLSGGPFWGVELGRRDGLISKAGRVMGNLPQPNFSLNLLNWIFRKNNLTQTDMVALSGAHTLGFSHCSKFSNRIYSFSGTSPVDPSLDRGYSQQLMQMCPRNVDPRIAINMDPSTPRTFDNAYYKNLVGKKGLFTSDQVLFDNFQSRQTVVNFANNPQSFSNAFSVAMVKLGRTGVKTGFQGEIRRDCSRFN
ncbi:Peroxidase 51 [Acorus gramineus]|uniref:Peroxidase n=1 Tax=Acorus gramineus TaxID=55184 RepID=A0AAV9A7G1_ACOGR|nr:Peroxidase 51 [Acorus gramineus]